MSGGGKGGSTTAQVQVPAWLEDAARANLARADDISRLGYRPSFGPDVAAFSPTQEAAFANTSQAAGAFGMQTPQGPLYPAPQTFAGGVRGYSSYPLYQESLAQYEAAMPGQYNAIRDMYINPVTGAAPVAPMTALTPPPAPAPQYDGAYGDGGSYAGGGYAADDVAGDPMSGGWGSSLW